MLEIEKANVSVYTFFLKASLIKISILKMLNTEYIKPLFHIIYALQHLGTILTYGRVTLCYLYPRSAFLIILSQVVYSSMFNKMIYFMYIATISHLGLFIDDQILSLMF